MKLCPHCDTGYPDQLITCPTHGVMLGEIRELRPGMVIRRTYRIVRKLGQGGMGTVYLARQTLMDEPRALKFLSSEFSSDKAFTSRFLREVRTLRQVRHRNVVDCGDLEPAEDDSLFFSMEFVDGPDLRQLLHEAAGPLDVPMALALARGIAEGLGAAHAVGLVHRDIKPENILLARTGTAYTPKIADFGIVATKESSITHTRTGGSLLTPPYAAPEQWRGTRAAELDGRTDLYALGGVLFEMLTGQTVFEAESYEGWAEEHRNTPPCPPSQLRPELANWRGLDSLVVRLLAKDREDRPRDVAEVLALLNAITYVAPKQRRVTVKENPPPVAREPEDETAGEFPDNPPRKVPIWVWIVLVVAVLIVLVFTKLNPRSDYYTQAPAAQQRAISDAAQQGKTLFRQQRYSEAAPLVDKACSGGDQASCAELGVLYLQGNGEPKDLGKANTLLTNACNAGIADACASLGHIYSIGTGVAADHAHALALYSNACQGGSDEGCADLGLSYNLGLDTTADLSKGIEILSGACNGGMGKSCHYEAQMYFEGTNVTRNLAKAAALEVKSCDDGYAQGCSYAGFDFLNGQGIGKNKTKADQYLKKGCSLGDKDSCNTPAGPN
jgi:serine/threonine-protein kinase